MKMFHFQWRRPKPVAIVLGFVILAALVLYFGMIEYEVRDARNSLSAVTRVEVRGNLLLGTNNVVEIVKTLTDHDQISALAGVFSRCLEGGLMEFSRYHGHSYATMLRMTFDFSSNGKATTRISLIGTSTVLLNERLICSVKEDYGLYGKTRKILEHASDSNLQP